MFISSRRKSGLFCLLSFLLIVISSVDGQLDDNAANKNGQQNNKINSIKVNKIVTSDSIEQPADSDRVVLSKKYTNLNSKYVTQSSVTSGPRVGLYMGPKKSEYKHCSRTRIRKKISHSNWHQLTSIVLWNKTRALSTCSKQQLRARNVLGCI